jgi:RNA polymerase sigma-70 factor, ECF subfamily
MARLAAPIHQAALGLIREPKLRTKSRYGTALQKSRQPGQNRPIQSLFNDLSRHFQHANVQLHMGSLATVEELDSSFYHWEYMAEVHNVHGSRDADVIPLRPALGTASNVDQSRPAGPFSVVDLTDQTKASAESPTPRTAPPLDTAADILRTLIDEHALAMFGLAKSIVRDSALAEDVVQESLLKAWQAADSYRGDASVRSWALRITHNTAISTLRKRREDYREPDLLPEPRESGIQTDRQVQGRMMVSDLWTALGTLDPLSRSVTVLREVEGMSYEDIASLLELPLPTVKTRLFRARKTLSSVLGEWK